MPHVRPRPTRLIGGLLLTAALALVPVAGIATAQRVLQQRNSLRPPCPALPLSYHPASFHLRPGVVEHQSWLEFAVPAHFAGTFALCYDGHALQVGEGVLDFHDGLARFNVQTRLVTLYWISRSLDQLQELSRWELRLSCAPDYQCE